MGEEETNYERTMGGMFVMTELLCGVDRTALWCSIHETTCIIKLHRYKYRHTHICLKVKLGKSKDEWIIPMLIF